MVLLLAGGHEDPNLTVLAQAAQRTNVDLLDLRLPASESRAFCWNPGESAARLDGKELTATAGFIRYDVFGGMQDTRPEVSARAHAWYQTALGWLLSEPGIRMFNRRMSAAATNKPAALVLAKTDLRNGLAASPAIVQKRLVAPEVRIYVIGQSAFAFEVRSNSLDYRVNQDAELILLPEAPPEISHLRQLMSRLGLDFGAADFKTDPDTGHLVFLELNTSPMFARFDQVSQGRLCQVMLQELGGLAAND